MQSEMRSPRRSRAWLACCIAALVVLAMSWCHTAAAQSVSIVATVNDEPISAWDVDQRVKFYQSTGGTGSVESLKKRALDELVNELLMTQEARRVGVTVEDTEVRDMIEARLKPLNRTYSQFRQYLSSRGVDIATLENQLRAKLVWTSVVRRNFGGLVSITEADIDEAASEIDTDQPSGEEDVLVLQKILLKVPRGSPDHAYADRMAEAERIRDLFIDCSRNKETLRRFQDVNLEELSDAKASDFEEPTRSLVNQARAGQVTPPNVTAVGIEMIAVCERGEAGGRRRAAERQLLTQELSMLSERHLRDLRQDAVVDYR